MPEPGSMDGFMRLPQGGGRRSQRGTRKRADMSAGAKSCVAVAAPGRICGLALLVLLLSACGFQFQGPLSFPALSGGVWLQSAHGATPLWRALKEQLRLARVDVRSEPGEGVAILRLLEDDSQESVVAISANNLPTVTEINYRVRYSLRLGARRLIEDREREANHTRVQDEFRVLGMERDTEVLREALAEELAWQILRDLATLPVPAAEEPS